MTKKIYEKPYADITAFDADDIISASVVDISSFDDADIGGGSVNADPFWFTDNAGSF